MIILIDKRGIEIILIDKGGKAQFPLFIICIFFSSNQNKCIFIISSLASHNIFSLNVSSLSQKNQQFTIIDSTHTKITNFNQLKVEKFYVSKENPRNLIAKGASAMANELKVHKPLSLILDWFMTLLKQRNNLKVSIRKDDNVISQLNTERTNLLCIN